MKSRFLSLLAAIVLLILGTASGRAQYAVNDAVAQALISQGNSNFLQQMSTQFDKLNQQITQLQQIQTQGQQLVTIAGNPSQALSFASGSMGLNTSALGNNSVFQSFASIAGNVNGSRSLANTAGGIFQAISTSTPDGTAVTRNATAYNKYDAFEQEWGNFQNVLQNAQSQRQQLLSQLQTVMNTTPNTQADQSEKVARINGLSAQLAANDQAIRDANEQRQAQNEANSQDDTKQKQAEQETLNTEFNNAQSQADQQAASALSSITGQTP